jgi:hypothetical protein
VTPIGRESSLSDACTRDSRGKGRPKCSYTDLVRIAYRYELGPNRLSEKTLACRLTDHLVPNDLLLLDRCFWSYGLFWQIQRQQAFFGIRLFKTAKLKTLGRLSWKDRLVRYALSDRRWRGLGAA